MKRLLVVTITALLTFTMFFACGVIGSSALAGRWLLEEGQPAWGNPEDIELLKDGSGIIDSAGGSWKVENGCFYFTAGWGALAYDYKISGSTLILTDDDHTSLTYKKKR